MPQQRSKKHSASRKVGKKLDPTLVHDLVEEEASGNSDNEGSEIAEQDAEEEALARLVLGEGDEFMVELKRDIIEHVEVEGEEEEQSAAEEEEEGGLENVDDADLFFIDSGPSAIDPDLLKPQEHPDEEGSEGAAWEDSDDERLTISLAGHSRLRKLRVREDEDVVSGGEYTRRLRRQFERLNPAPEWASTRPAKRRRRSSASSGASNSSDGMDVDESDLSALPLAQFLQNAGSLTRTLVSSTKQPKLRPEVIDIQVTRSIPLVQPSAVTSLSFHPEYPVLLSSGLASTLYLHQIDPTAHPTPNPLLTSVHIRHTPLYTSSFLSPAGDKIIFSGRRKYFHVWDLPSGSIQKITRIYGREQEQRTMENFRLSPCGRYMALVGSSKKGGGIINVLDVNTMQWIAAMRIEGNNGIADFAWWSDGNGLTVVSKSSEVAEWSLESRSYVARWIDDNHAPTVLCLGGSNGPAALGGDRWVVIGSQSGIVNIYDRRTFVSPKNEISIPERPTPKRAFDQFTKPTDNVVISPDGQILCFSTKWKKDALRLVHLPSCTVFRNWPTEKTPLGRVTSVAFGRGSDMLAVGNEAGKIRLWEIRV